MMSSKILGCALMLIVQIAAVHAAPPAIEEFQALQVALAKDAQHKDWAACLADAKQLKAFLKDAPTSRLEVARAYLRTGDRVAALTEVQGFLALGETNDVLAAPAFEPIHAAISAQIDRNQMPVSHANATLELTRAVLLPEDIDFDPVTKRFFITSVLGGKIVSMDARGAQRVFADPPDAWPMVALKLDVKRRRLWVTEVAFNTFESVAPAERGRSALLEYDLDSARLLGRVEGPAHSALGDMALAPDGEPIVSDGEGGGVYRADHGVLRRIDHGEFISPQTPAFCAATNTVFIPDYVRGLARLHLDTGRVVWFSGDKHALYGIDGLYCRDRTLIATQNGATPARLVAFRLDAAQTGVASEHVIERGTPAATDMTHGVFIGKTFHFIANAGWAAMDERGVQKDPARGTNAIIMRVNMKD